jgi:acyl-CoA thioesterase YciA
MTQPPTAPCESGGPPTFPEGTVPSIRQVMMPRDTNAVGTIFGGVILAQIDLAAAIEAHKSHPARVVTVSMDRIEFKAPVFVGDLVSFFTRTQSIGRSSIRIHVAVWAQRRFGGGERVYVTEAEVTMVAVDDQGRPIPVMQPIIARK